MWGVFWEWAELHRLSITVFAAGIIAIGFLLRYLTERIERRRNTQEEHGDEAEFAASWRDKDGR